MTAPDMRPRRAEGQRGDYAVFIAVIAAALLLLGGIAYDGPRLIAARQDAAHTANEAARVAAATVASGGTLDEARRAAQIRAQAGGIYGQVVRIDRVDCVGSRVQIRVETDYVFRSALGIARSRQPIVATAAAEAQLVLPSGEPSTLDYLGECPLT